MIVKINVPYVATAKPVAASGNPTKFDGKPTWAVTDPNTATLVVSEDGYTAQITFLKFDDAGQVTCIGDGKQGPGENPIPLIADYVTLAEDAVSGTITFVEVV